MKKDKQKHSLQPWLCWHNGEDRQVSRQLPDAITLESTRNVDI